MIALPPLYPITDARLDLSLAEQVRRLGEAGFPLVQFRGKPLDPAAQWAELRKALLRAREDGGWPLVCVNDRADLAVLAAREGLAPWGLHLGQSDLPPSEARALPGLEGLSIGTSTHEPAEWDAVDPACDHAGLGPFRATGTKADHEPPIGLQGLAAGCAALRARGLAPVAIGGLTLGDAEACFGAGAESLAMIGEVHRAADPAELGWAVQGARWRARPPLRRGRGLVIAGGSGAGKSTLGRLLAEGLGLPFHDLDEVVAGAAGPGIPEIFAAEGEAGFRARERGALAPLLASPSVVALGGGAWEQPEVRAAVAAAGADPLWLAEVPRRAWARAGGDPGRPLAQDEAGFLARYARRAGAWSRLPALLPFGRGAGELAEAILAAAGA